MILNVERFINEERPYWEELERRLAAPERLQGLGEAKRFFYLYRRAASGLVKLNTLAAGPEIRAYLETLVGRAYAEIHAAQDASARVQPFRWFFVEFPRTVRKHHRALWTSIAITLLGTAFGALAMRVDYENAKSVVMPFSHLQGSPTERVQKEESAESKIAGHESSFATMLMQNNIRVSIFAAALGMTYALGTITLLFYNGVILGAVGFDYIHDGQLVFLLGWLLPHGVVEIPSILFAGQAGLVLGNALIGYHGAAPLRERLRTIAPRLGYLSLGVAVLLVWAGIIEAFVSQYHAPVLPYSVKIGFGLVEFGVLVAFITYGGSKRSVAELAAEEDDV